MSPICQSALLLINLKHDNPRTCLSSKSVVNNRMSQWVDERVHLQKRNLSLSSSSFEPQIHSHDLHTLNTEYVNQVICLRRRLPINSSCALIGRVTASQVALLLPPVSHTPTFSAKCDTCWQIAMNCKLNSIQVIRSIVFNICTKSTFQSINGNFPTVLCQIQNIFREGIKTEKDGFYHKT